MAALIENNASVENAVQQQAVYTAQNTDVSVIQLSPQDIANLYNQANYGGLQVGTTQGYTGMWTTVAWGGSGLVFTTAKPKPKLTAARVFALVKRCWRTNSLEPLTKLRSSAASLAAQAQENGQTALYEEMSKRVASISVELRLLEAGFATYIDRTAINRFATRDGADTHLTNIENFGRPIPDGVATKLKAARDSKLFSGFTVLHAGMAMIKTTAQKIREKDPILFGTVEAHPDRLYVIADWLDEWCHLTLSELITHDDFTGSLEAVEVDEAKLAAEVARRDELLATARPSTWKNNEQEARKMEGVPATAPWYIRMFFRPKK